MPRPGWLALVAFCCLYLNPIACSESSGAATVPPVDAPPADTDHDSSTPAPITVQNDFQVVIDSDNAIQLQRRDGRPIEENMLTSFDGVGDYSLVNSNPNYDNEERLNQLNQAIDLQRLTPASDTEPSRPIQTPLSDDFGSLSKDENTSESPQKTDDDKAAQRTVTPSPKTFVTPSTEQTNIFANQNVFLPKPITVHRHVKSLPSFSKMPDHLFTQLNNNEIVDSSASFSEDAPSYTPMKPLIVPTGSRVHTIKYLDYPETVVSNTVMPTKSSSSSSSYSPSEPSSSHSSLNDNLSDSDINSKPFEPIIELTGTRPVLPIVFNFRTSSSPVITKTSLKTLYDEPRPKSKPKTKYYKTEQPAEYSRQVIHKPVEMPALHYDAAGYTSTVPQHSPSYYQYKMPKFSSVEYADYDYMPASTPTEGAFNKFNYPFYALPQTPIYVPDSPATGVGRGSNSFSSSGPASYLSSFFYPIQRPSLYHSTPGYSSHTPTYLASPSFYQNRYTTYHSPMAESTQYFTQAFPFVDADYVNLAAFNRYK